MSTHRVTTILTTTTTTIKKETRQSASPSVSASKALQSSRLSKAATAPKFYEYFCRGMYRMKQAANKPKPSPVRKSVDTRKR